MDNIQSVHKWLHLYLVILFLLFVSRILAFNFMLMSVKIQHYRAIIITGIIIIIYGIDLKSVWLKFSGGWGGDTFKTPSPYEQLLPLPTPCFKILLERSLNDPQHPTSSIPHRYPLPIHHPFPRGGGG